jgi:hypothetical protein
MYAWEFAERQHVADLGGWRRFVSMQRTSTTCYADTTNRS